MDTSEFAKKDDLVNLKSEVDKLYIDKLSELDADKLKPVPVDLKKKKSNVVDKKVVEKDLYSAKIKDTENKIPDISKVATNAALNAKINEVNGEIPSFTNLATTTALTAVENKIPNVSD